jgi:hypothetical protein
LSAADDDRTKKYDEINLKCDRRSAADGGKICERLDRFAFPFEIIPLHSAAISRRVARWPNVDQLHSDLRVRQSRDRKNGNCCSTRSDRSAASRQH